MEELLFSSQDLGALLHARRQHIKGAVEAIPEDQFLSSTSDQLRDYLVADLRIESIVLYEDRAEKRLNQGSILARDRFRYDLRNGEGVKVPSLELITRIPYSGPAELWQFQPSMYTSNPPRGHVSHPDGSGIGYLTLRVVIDAQAEESDRLAQETNSLIERVRAMVAAQRGNIEQFNTELPRHVDELVAWRKKNYERFLAAAEKLRVPISMKADAPPLTPLRIEKRSVPALPPATKTAGLAPEHGITDQSYEQILHAIRNQGRQFERTPATYAQHDEEGLRDIIWGNLATHFGRDVNGEAFSKAGKTDIRIEEEGRAAFIAECKVWRGAREMQGALAQLLGYLRWRDCKTALIVFNKDRDNFTALLDKAPAALRDAKCFRGDVKLDSAAGEARMVFASPDDENRRVTVHLFLFDLFAPK